MTKEFHCAQCTRQFATLEGLEQHGRVKRHEITAVPEAERPVLCIECGSAAEVVGGERIYPHRPDLSHKRFWLCSCGAYCGSHGLTTRALGSPCGPVTRRARLEAHDWFDQIWKTRQMDRSRAYQWLSDQMGIPKERTHIGMMTAAQAWRVVEICKARVGK